jgi:hypothetical protein
LAERMYHADTFKPAYVDSLQDQKLHVDQYQDRCPIPGPVDDMHTVAQELITDSYGYGVADPSH